jgi:hypothetical protein
MPVDFRYAQIVDEDYERFYRRDYGDLNFGNWAIPSLDSLCASMRTIYESNAVWRARARQASEIIAREFSWDAIGTKAVAAAADLQKKAYA